MKLSHNALIQLDNETSFKEETEVLTQEFYIQIHVWNQDI